MPAHAHQILLPIVALSGLPRLDGAFGQRARPVRDGPLVINGDDAPKTAAVRAAANRVMETKERGRRLAIFQIASRAVIQAGKILGVMDGEGRMAHPGGGEFPLAK